MTKETEKRKLTKEIKNIIHVILFIRILLFLMQFSILTAIIKNIQIFNIPVIFYLVISVILIFISRFLTKLETKVIDRNEKYYNEKYNEDEVFMLSTKYLEKIKDKIDNIDL